MGLETRLGITTEDLEQFGLLQDRLDPPETHLQKAAAAASTNPKAVQAQLAAAILSQAERTSEGRLAAALALLAPLVAKSDPRMTIGPDGRALRADVMPNGWQYTICSWPRLRYAWREGMRSILTLGPEDKAIVDALDEVTRLSPAEPEPVSVAIQEQWPSPVVTFVISLLGLGSTAWMIGQAVEEHRKRKAARR